MIAATMLCVMLYTPQGQMLHMPPCKSDKDAGFIVSQRDFYFLQDFPPEKRDELERHLKLSIPGIIIHEDNQ